MSSNQNKKQPYGTTPEETMPTKATNDQMMYRMKEGKVETRLFRAGEVIDGWHEDKYKAGYKKPVKE